MELFCCLDLLCRIDFWTLILTGISAVAVIIIAVIQIRMQRVQTKMQEYEFYKEPYLLMVAIHQNINGLIYHIAYTLNCETRLTNFEVDFLKKKREDLNEASSKLSASRENLTLVANMTDLQYANYTLALIYMKSILDNVICSLEDGSLRLTKNKCISLNDDKSSIEYILGCITEENRSKLRDSLKYFSDLKKNISEYNILMTLEKHCTLYRR